VVGFDGWHLKKTHQPRPIARRTVPGFLRRRNRPDPNNPAASTFDTSGTGVQDKVLPV
jgi:hypothetical protein